MIMQFGISDFEMVHFCRSFIFLFDQWTDLAAGFCPGCYLTFMASYEFRCFSHGITLTLALRGKTGKKIPLVIHTLRVFSLSLSEARGSFRVSKSSLFSSAKMCAVFSLS